MFLILAMDIGGAPIFRTFTRLWGREFAEASAGQFSYAFGEGMRLSLVAMPMFLFVVGVVIPMGMRRRQQQDGRVYWHVFRRSAILFLFGLIAGGHLFSLQFAEMPLYNNVLEYIGVGYLVCSMIVLNTTWRTQVLLTAAMLLLYWAILVVIPVPGGDGNPYSSKMNLAIYLDNVLLGLHHKPGSWQILATISFVANIMIGALVGRIFLLDRPAVEKSRRLLIAGAAMLAAGMLWGLFFPIIRSLWTSSYVLVTCGISTLVLAMFHHLIDARGRGAWAFFFIVFGVNSIAIYMMAHLFDFRLIGNIVVGGFSKLFSDPVRDFIQAMAAMAVMWLITYYMYIKKTFLKI